MNLIRPGGLILVDNTLWSGQVLRPEDEDSRAIDALNRHISTKSPVRADFSVSPVP